MNEAPVFETKRNVSADETRAPAGAREEAAEDPITRFVERHHDFFEAYAGDNSLTIRSAESVVTPDGPLETCAIDLEHGTVYLHPRFLSDVYGGSEAKVLFGACHEIEHFRELRSLLREKDGANVWRAHRQKIEGKRRYHILDNSFDDVKMNRTVVERAPTLRETRRALYLENLFPERDLTKLPKHLQFAHALNVEQQDMGERWTVAPDVREALETVRTKRGRSGVDFIDYASHPNTPMSVRLMLQEAVIEPLYERFFEEDVAKKREEEKGGGGKEQGKHGGETGEKPEQGEGEPSGAQPEAGEKEGEAGESENPEKYFAKEYDDILKRHRHATPDDMVDAEVEKEIKRQVAASADERIGERAFEAYAHAQGVTPEDLRNYRRFAEELECIENPETNERVVEELRALFEKIITRRKKRVLAPKYPLPEGDTLEFPAEAVVRTRAGEEESDVWGDVELREKEDKLIGDFDVTVVGDVSGSMDGAKADAQRVAIALVLEALGEFSDELETRRTELAHDLHVRTEGWVFGDKAECVKTLSEELTEKERVAMHKRLGNPNGGNTRDFLALEELLKNLSNEEREKMEHGKLKKILMVMTDGESDDVPRVKMTLTKFREAGVIAVGIGITKGGTSALTTYAPDAKLCERVEDLPNILATLLKEHLRGL